MSYQTCNSCGGDSFIEENLIRNLSHGVMVRGDGSVERVPQLIGHDAPQQTRYLCEGCGSVNLITEGSLVPLRPDDGEVREECTGTGGCRLPCRRCEEVKAGTGQEVSAR
jgi:hypothetical protein